MSVPSVHCEARKIAYRQTKEGLVVAFVIHPNEMPDALAVAPLGQRYMLALAAIGDDEQPIARLDPSAKPPDEQHVPGGITWVDENLQPIPSRAKAAYAQATPGEQAVTRAALLCADPKFREWIAHNGDDGEDLVDEKEAAQFIRDHCCFGESRKEIAEDPECLARFLALEVDYKIHIGVLPEPR